MSMSRPPRELIRLLRALCDKTASKTKFRLLRCPLLVMRLCCRSSDHVTVNQAGQRLKLAPVQLTERQGRIANSGNGREWQMCGASENGPFRAQRRLSEWCQSYLLPIVGAVLRLRVCFHVLRVSSFDLQSNSNCGGQNLNVGFCLDFT